MFFSARFWCCFDPIPFCSLFSPFLNVKVPFAIVYWKKLTAYFHFYKDSVKSLPVFSEETLDLEFTAILKLLTKTKTINS